jgi:hypothetical protein
MRGVIKLSDKMSCKFSQYSGLIPVRYLICVRKTIFAPPLLFHDRKGSRERNFALLLLLCLDSSFASISTNINGEKSQTTTHVDRTCRFQTAYFAAEMAGILAYVKGLLTGMLQKLGFLNKEATIVLLGNSVQRCGLLNHLVVSCQFLCEISADF